MSLSRYIYLVFIGVCSPILTSVAQTEWIVETGQHFGIEKFQHDEMSEFERMNYWLANKMNQDELIDAGILELNRGTKPLFAFPLKTILSDPGFFGISNYVDLNSGFPNQLEDFNCGARTYDTTGGYNHQGIDYFTWPFGWHKMDNSLVSIHAVADGVISLKSDGHNDRSCTFNGNQWNAVFVTHADGSVVWYGHMKNGSLTAKTVGQSVVAGEYLGVVGSSGNSTGPHLHMETYDSLNNLIEPHAGACNSFNNNSWWLNQETYYQSQIVKLATHATAPTLPTCPNTVDQPNYKNHFSAGETVYLARYYRDQREGHSSTMTIKTPDNVIYNQWSDTLTGVTHYAASFWWNSIILPANPQSGEWRFEVLYQGETTVHKFYVNDVIFSQGFDT